MSTVIVETKRCKRCNRILTDPLSIARGYGPECKDKIALELMVTEHAREANWPGWLCETCEKVTPSRYYVNYQCPMCRYGITALAELDSVPFAEVG